MENLKDETIGRGVRTMMKTRKEHIQDFLFMLAGAVFTSLIIISFENIEFSVSRLALYAIAGCLAGYGLREVVLRNAEKNVKEK